MNLTKTDEYRILSKLPNKISGLQSKLKTDRKAFEDALNRQEENEKKLENAYQSGSSDDISRAKRKVRNVGNDIERLKKSIDQANTDLESAYEALEENTIAYRKKVVNKAEKILKDFDKNVDETIKLNEQLRELNTLRMFGEMTIKRSAVPLIPTIKPLKENQSKILKKKINQWRNSAIVS